MKIKMKATKLELNESCKTKSKLTLEVELVMAANHTPVLKLDFK